ncbi:C-type lectin mannose-binding isoform-like [Saccoglossus kowalevskii]|uniref:Uncharacterized protein LOC100375504 n=1 Tax=Saccoglossus kowalevskii TaxID=10224 RepID=A0ABM0GJ77_SACKO|nr:PREDICTED: uncharacterized protein LOC100375504 [Saccoglossus kowalevskii]
MKSVVISLAMLCTSVYATVDFYQVGGPAEVCDPSNGMRYKFFYDLKYTWLAAKDACALDSGVLAKIDDSDLHKRFRRYINSENDIKNPMGGGYWFGLNDRLVEGSFVFIDDTPLSYDGWSSRKVGKKTVTQPNNNVQKDCHGQDCGQLWQFPKKRNKNATWHFDDAYCLDKKSFICMYENGCSDE